MKFKWTSYAVLLSALVGCSDAEFASRKSKDTKAPPGQDSVEDPKPPQPTVEAEAVGLIEISCADQEQGNIVKAISGTDKRKYQVIGEICHTTEVEQPKAELTVSFVVDTSGSMYTNDMYQNGTCGRYEAIQAIMNKLKNDIDDTVEVKVGVIGFGGISTEVLSLTNLSDAQMDVASICGAYGGTNYQAAFNHSYNTLSQVSGRKAVYFISDGMPTMSTAGLDHVKNGLDAALNLRNSIKDVSLFSVYLEDKMNQTLIGYNSAEEYLEAITGNKENIKIVQKASDLATGITEFKLPDPIDPSMSKPVIKIQADDKSEISIELDSFEKINDSKWKFVSKEFQPYGQADSMMENELKFSLKAGDDTDKSFDVMIENTVK